MNLSGNCGNHSQWASTDVHRDSTPVLFQKHLEKTKRNQQTSQVVIISTVFFRLYHRNCPARREWLMPFALEMHRQLEASGFPAAGEQLQLLLSELQVGGYLSWIKLTELVTDRIRWQRHTKKGDLPSKS